MEYQFLQSFLSNMDNMISFAIYGTAGNCVLVEGTLKNNHELLDKIYGCIKCSISSTLPIFQLVGSNEDIFRCVKTGQTGFMGKSCDGNILIAQKSSSASVIFLGHADFKGSHLYSITRGLKQQELLNNINANIDFVNFSVNNHNKGRLKG